MRSSVVLPVPLAPTSAVLAPSPTRKLTSSNSTRPSGSTQDSFWTSTYPCRPVSAGVSSGSSARVARDLRPARALRSRRTSCRAATPAVVTPQDAATPPRPGGRPAAGPPAPRTAQDAAAGSRPQVAGDLLARPQLVVGRVGDVLEHQPVRRRDRDVVGPRRPRQQLPGHSVGRRPSPTASIAPTSERTIEWQNASARTVSTSSPSAVRSQASASSARTVVAPSRRRQYAAKSCSPSSGGQAACSAARSSGAARSARRDGAAGRRARRRRRRGSGRSATAPRSGRRSRRGRSRRGGRGRPAAAAR